MGVCVFVFVCVAAGCWLPLLAVVGVVVEVVVVVVWLLAAGCRCCWSCVVCLCVLVLCFVDDDVPLGPDRSRQFESASAHKAQGIQEGGADHVDVHGVASLHDHLVAKPPVALNLFAAAGSTSCGHLEELLVQGEALGDEDFLWGERPAHVIIRKDVVAVLDYGVQLAVVPSFPGAFDGVLVELPAAAWPAFPVFVQELELVLDER